MHYFKAPNGTSFNFNSDMSGAVHLAGRFNATEREVDAADLLSFVEHWLVNYHDDEDVSPRVFDAVRGLFAVARGKPIVHSMREGYALCGIPSPSSSWGPGHKWVSFFEPSLDVEVTCEFCAMNIKAAREGAIHADFPEAGD